MGFTKAEGDALNAAVGGIVERCISSLEAVGLPHESALRLMLVQSVIRMRDMSEARRVFESVEDGLQMYD
jgi:hypothetical protein